MSNITLIDMAKKGDLNGVKECLDKNADINYKPKRAKPLYHSMTALMTASWEGHFEIVKYLIDNGADINIQGDIGYIREMWTALMCASENGHLEIVKYLVENGADINIKDYVGYTAILNASRRGHLDVVKYLLQNDAYINDFTELSLFIDALENSDIELEKLILSREFNINASIDIKDEYGCTSLVRALQSNNIETVKLLLKNGADINARCSDGSTPLMTASSYRHIKLVKYLIDNGTSVRKAADINAQDYDGKTALMCASEGIHYESDEGRIDVVKILVEYGADINIRDRKGNTALMFATDKGDHYIHDVVSFLIKNGATVNNNGSIVLIAAAISGDLERVKYIVENPYLFNVYIKNEKKFNPTALMYASKEGHIEIVKFLVASGADVNLKNGEGTTALMFASMNGHIEIIKFLVASGADIKIFDMHAKTALKYATNKGHIEIVKYLENNGKTVLEYATDNGHLEMNYYVQALEGLIYILQINEDNQWNEWLQKDIDYWMKDKEVEHHLSAYGGMGSFNDIMIGSMEGEIDYIFRFLKSFCSEFCKLYHSKKSNATALELQKKVLNDINKDSHHSLKKLNQLITQRLENGTVLEIIKIANNNRIIRQYFIDNAPKINIEDQSRIALIRASQRGMIELVEYYLRDPKYNDINIKSIDGYTALMVASANGHLEVVKFLIDNGADINIKANNGTSVCSKHKTALEYARDYGHTDIVKYLKQNGAQ